MYTFYKNLAKRIKELREKHSLSQEILANKIGISRVSLSQIENASRAVSAEELSKLSKIFNLSTDILIDFSSPTEIIIEKESKNIEKKKKLRISIPQKHLDKFKEILLYILNKIGSKPNVGESVIYKILYFIDFDFYEKYEEQLIGATYIKNNYGPTPREFIKVIENMKKHNDIEKIKTKYFEFPQTKYLPLRTPDLSKFKAHEKELIDNVLERLSDMTAREISDYSHGDVPWIATEKGEQINYESVFYRTLPYSFRKDEDKDDNIQ
ncbi:type II toxin-antitoxin system antitoxin SocA domain-containing protein [bacterium]